MLTLTRCDLSPLARAAERPARQLTSADTVGTLVDQIFGGRRAPHFLLWHLDTEKPMPALIMHAAPTQ